MKDGVTMQRYGTMRWLGVLLVLGLAMPAAAEVAIGVAAFERVAARGQVVPDVATRLAQRLGTRGVEKSGRTVRDGRGTGHGSVLRRCRGLGEGAGVAAVVVGKTTRLGRSLSVDARIYDSGGNLLGGPLVEEVTRVEDLGRAIEALADQIVERVGEGNSGPPQVASQPPGAAAPEGVVQQQRRTLLRQESDFDQGRSARIPE